MEKQQVQKEYPLPTFPEKITHAPWGVQGLKSSESSKFTVVKWKSNQ